MLVSGTCCLVRFDEPLPATAAAPLQNCAAQQRRQQQQPGYRYGRPLSCSVASHVLAPVLHRMGFSSYTHSICSPVPAAYWSTVLFLKHAASQPGRYSTCWVVAGLANPLVARPLGSTAMRRVPWTRSHQQQLHFEAVNAAGV